MKPLISSSYFAKALSTANTAITVAKNSGCDANDAVRKALPDTIQAIVDLPEDRFAAAAAKTGLMDVPVLMDGTLTPFGNMVINAARIVVVDALSLKKDFVMGISNDELNDIILDIWKANDFKRTEQVKRTSGDKADPNAIVEDGCGGACSI